MNITFVTENRKHYSKIKEKMRKLFGGYFKAFKHFFFKWGPLRKSMRDEIALNQTEIKFNGDERSFGNP